MNKKKKSKAWIPFILIIVAALLFLAFRLIGIVKPELLPGKTPIEEVEEEGTTEESIFAVNTILSRTMELNEYLELNGDVITTDQVDVYPDTAGKLVRIPVKIGSYVNKDEIVAWIDPSRPGMNYAESPVESPISGTVTAVYGTVGGMAAPQGQILSVGNLSSLQVTVFIPELFTSRIYPRMPAALSFETFPDQAFTARVAEISPVVDPVSRTMEVKLDITGSRGQIKPGMFAKVSLILDKKEAAVAVPAGCIVYRQGKTYIFTVEGETVSMTEVTPGITENGYTEILDGIEPERELVYQGMNLLEDGAKIRIVNRLEKVQ